ncbi:S8 family peptidase [Spirosoma validum]|uniref:S8 family peptidase n=1 Tax=Spirosoma validum TaxID=2771355 RepID=A0A927GGH4_9BACT|nr:S8 family peptidase [Spirosoma validum]MBD2756997.1 S8 family peptidase [Spirosoma validum]
MSQTKSASDENRPVDYFAPLVESLSQSLIGYQFEQIRRQQERNPDLAVPVNITCIEINFPKRFDATVYEPYYRNTFGLSPVQYTNFHQTALFAVVDEVRFRGFIGQVQRAIESQDHNNPNYDTHIRFVRSFSLLTSERIRSRIKNPRDVIYLSLIEDTEIFQTRVQPILTSLNKYLVERNIEFVFNYTNNTIEIPTIDEGTLLEIAKNFDIVHTISSANAGIRVRPSELGQVVRELRFRVINASEDLPIIGIIDTGVSDQTPLAPLLIDVGNDFDVTGGNGRVDSADHGTGVASLAVFGERLANIVSDELEADAKILPIKVLSGSTGYLPNHVVVNYIRRANQEHGVRLFVLTICYADHLETNELTSEYAYALDKLAYELDILICISTGNRDHDISLCVPNYPTHFLDDCSNIKSPSESMNNLTVGAVGDNFEEVPITINDWPVHDGSLPAIYTRKFHLSHDIKEVNRNRHVRKPDVVFSGGNYLEVNHPLFGASHDSTMRAGMQFFSENFIAQGLIRDAGTSYSAPLIANIAAKILRRFPSLRMQSVKALIVNSADECNSFNHHGLTEKQEQFIYGHGRPSLEKCLSSNDNEVTIVIEDKVDSGMTKSYPIYLPDYLQHNGKENALLKVEATLCFSFQPIQYNQMAYCPVNITFGVFKNLPLFRQEQIIDEDGKIRLEDTGIVANHKENVVLHQKGYWSQDGFGKGKLLSNVQKVELNISRSNLINEAFEFKIAVGCRRHGNLSDAQAISLPTSYNYSLVIRIKENLPESQLSNRLFDELVSLNELEVLGRLDLEADLEADAE